MLRTLWKLPASNACCAFRECKTSTWPPTHHAPLAPARPELALLVVAQRKRLMQDKYY